MDNQTPIIIIVAVAVLVVLLLIIKNKKDRKKLFRPGEGGDAVEEENRDKLNRRDIQ